MLITDPPGIDPSSLRDRMSGRVSAPGDLDWDEARQAWNIAVDQRPAAVAIPHSADDVIAIVDFASERGLRVTAQGTGHNAAAYDTLADTILVKTQEMRGVEIDADARVARIAAGALWIEVTEPASALGLAPLAGSSPDVGVVGYTLGGGSSWLARKYGLSANSVVAIELVTADGELVRADAEHHADLFWALRGGGGNFGVVTHMEIRLYPLTEVYAGMMFWPWERSAEVLKAWAGWTRTAPDEVTTSARLMQIPPLPDIPEFLRGRALVVIDGAFVGDEAAGAALLQPLRDLGPEMDTFAMIPPVALSRIHMDPEGPTPAIAGGGQMLRALTDEAIDAFVAVAGPGSGSALLMAELRHLGGALGRAPEGHGALAGFAGDYLVFGAGIPVTPDIAAAIHTGIAALIDAIAPWDIGSAYLNFTEEPVDPARFFSAEAYARLRRVKATVDPEGRFRGNHAIEAA
jgi:FAD/FMN-containing dehydrogenase